MIVRRHLEMSVVKCRFCKNEFNSKEVIFDGVSLKPICKSCFDKLEHKIS